MQVLLDTNILISAALFPNGVASKAYFKAIEKPYSAVVCEWSIDELHRVFNRKFPNRLDVLNKFLVSASTSFRIIKTPDEEVADEEKIRDVKDRPLLRSAQIEGVDILLTGDLDFLESGVNNPMILNPVQFLEMEHKLLPNEKKATTVKK